VFDGTHAAAAVHALREAAQGLAPLQVLLVAARADAALPGARTLVDHHGLLARRYDGTPSTAYLLRPDQHVCARWRRVSPDAAHQALRRALALP
jgi:3-(3-hydroxy-phenyl)propionate hydroxylase